MSNNMNNPEKQPEQWIALPKEICDRAFTLLGEMPAKMGSFAVMQQINQYGVICDKPIFQNVEDVVPGAEIVKAEDTTESKE